MQVICETLFPPPTSEPITFLSYCSYTTQSIPVVTTATFIPVYLFIARQTRDRMSGVTHQNLIGYISAISIPIHFWFSRKLSAVQGQQSKLQPEVPYTSGQISKFSTSTLKIGERALPLLGEGAGSPSNTNSLVLRPTTMPSINFIRPAVWSQ